MQPRAAEVWKSGTAYEAYVGRWSRLVAREFLGWLGRPPGGQWLDVGCGTGILSQSILGLTEPATVVGVDPSEGFMSHARAQITDPRARFEIGDARALPVADAAFETVVSGLVLNFVPAAERAMAVSEMRRAVRPGGVVAVYVWDYAAGMQIMRQFWDAAVALDAAVRTLDEGQRVPRCEPDSLAELFDGAGLGEFEARAVDVPTVFRDFDDYWTPFLGGQGPAPAYAMSLGEERRDALRELIRSRLPFAADGSIPLTARAWAVRGSRAPG